MTMVEGLLEEGRSLAEALRYREAIQLLTDANLARPDSAIEKELVRLRHEAIVRTPTQPLPGPWPRPYEDLFPDAAGIPEITGAELTAERLGSAITNHGSLLVRNLIPADAAATLVSEIDEIFASYDRAAERGATEDLPWYSPFQASEPYSWTTFERLYTREGGGTMAPDSPRGLAHVLQAYHDAGIGPVFEEYLGEWPAVSHKKFTLRRTPPDAPTEWHQDGSFLGDGIRTVNIWLSLTDSGVDAPGLDLVGRRFDSLVDMGTDGSLFDWSVASDVADRAAEGNIVSPVFAPGDAIMFDQLALHRTNVSPTMTKDRYAIESWFFAPSTYPHDRIPIAF